MVSICDSSSMVNGFVPLYVDVPLVDAYVLSNILFCPVILQFDGYNNLNQDPKSESNLIIEELRF